MIKVPLTPDRIAEAAFGLIEAQGLQEFSIRKLGQRLGCEAMSIYHHFPSKAHLMDALVDRAIGDLTVPPNLPFRSAIEASARAFRGLGQRRPSFFAFLAVHRLNTPKALAWLDATLAVFRKAGFPDREAAWHFRILGYYLMGAILDETNGYAKGPGTVQTLAPEVVARDFPHVFAAGPHFSPSNWDAIFERGLAIVLDGIEAARPR